ncbi:FLYWCH transcription factor 2-like [Macrobrachium nipponense]|uniref:FLYWCH transcription factor 2-like n=1 Tax=Macrobrachium nipponense TaxID=159736 RepID=UPI0030C819CF
MKTIPRHPPLSKPKQETEMTRIKLQQRIEVALHKMANNKSVPSETVPTLYRSVPNDVDVCGDDGDMTIILAIEAKKSDKAEEFDTQTEDVALGQATKYGNVEKIKAANIPSTVASGILSQRDKGKFVRDGYTYGFDRHGADNSTEFWRCERRRLCKARIHVKNGEIVKNINDHSHNADPAQVEKGKIVSKIKLRASETMEQTSVVTNECLENVNEAYQGVMPSHSALRKMVRRERKALSAYPPNPTSLEELVIPVDIQNYGSENFF